MEAVIKETLRVRPVVTEVFRAPAEPVELDGYLVEPGTQLAASLFLVQFDPELYPPDPQEFRPERFLDGAPEPYTWVPFGGGVRRCLGAAFAQLEMKMVIGAILKRARLRAPRSERERARFRGATVLPSRGGEAVVESVSSPAAARCAFFSPRRARNPFTSSSRVLFAGALNFETVCGAYMPREPSATSQPVCWRAWSPISCAR